MPRGFTRVTPDPVGKTRQNQAYVLFQGLSYLYSKFHPNPSGRFNVEQQQTFKHAHNFISRFLK